jgi:biotin operon repressor
MTQRIAGAGRLATVPIDEFHKLEPGPRDLYVHLVGLADRDGISYQSHERISEALGVSRRTLYRWARALEAAGVAYRISGGYRGRIVRWAITRLQGAARELTKAISARRFAMRRNSFLGRLRKEQNGEREIFLSHAERVTRMAPDTTSGRSRRDPTSIGDLLGIPKPAIDPLDTPPQHGVNYDGERCELDGRLAYRDGRSPNKVKQKPRLYTPRQEQIFEQRRAVQLGALATFARQGLA